MWQFIYFHWPDAIPDANSLDNTDLFFALVMTPGFYLRHIEVADQDPASGNTFSNKIGEQFYK